MNIIHVSVYVDLLLTLHAPMKDVALRISLPIGHNGSVLPKPFQINLKFS